MSCDYVSRGWLEFTGTLVALFVLLEVWTATTLLLASVDVLKITGWNFIDPIPSSSGFSAGTSWVTGSEIYRSVEMLYAWNFLDAIPELSIPETLHWKLEHELSDVAGGTLLLTFKILAILPVASLIVGLIKGSEGKES